MKILLQISLVFYSLLGWAGEIPNVPKHIDFANMKLVLTDGVVKEIQNDVNAIRVSDKHFQQQLDLVSLYFPIIEKILKEENVPEDFKYLVIQESGLISDAVSVANAVGFWQFKDFTAREVGLRVDNRVDERKNIVSSTRAAARYLKRNNFQFDNWVYAMSAYQAGVGGARKYVEQKYYGAKRLQISKKSHWYLKKYIAHKIAYENEIGRPHSNGLRLDLYKKGEGKDLDRIAKEIKVESELLKFYNKWIKYGKIPSDKEYFVIVPTNKKVSKQLADLEKEKPEKTIEVPEEIPEPIVYPEELKPGISNKRGIKIKINGIPTMMATQLDDLTTLAAAGGLSNKQFLKYNDLGSDAEIKSGEVYFLRSKKSNSDIGFHIAQKEETLWSVSQHYGIRLKVLARKNRISIIDEIKQGQVLWLNSRRPKNFPIEYHDLEDEEILPPKTNDVPVVVQSKKTDDPNPISTPSATREEEPEEENREQTGKTHQVEAGETLWGISREYDVTVDELKEWNHLTKYDTLRIGQKIFVDTPKFKKKSERKTKNYTVKPGDTLYRIAEAHKMEVVDLMELNNKKDSYLSVGEVLKVYK